MLLIFFFCLFFFLCHYSILLHISEIYHFNIYVQSKDEAELGNLGKTQLQDSAPMGVS